PQSRREVPVFARVTQLEIDGIRIPVDQAVDRFEQETLPGLRDRPGYRGLLVLTTPAGKAALVSLWETEAAAQTQDPFYTDELAKSLTLFRSAPGREAYRVALLDGCRLTGV